MLLVRFANNTVISTDLRRSDTPDPETPLFFRALIHEVKCLDSRRGFAPNPVLAIRVPPHAFEM